MNRNLHQIDNVYKEAIEQWQDSPGLSVWTNIEKKLDEHTSLRIRNRDITFRKLLLVAILILPFIRSTDIAKTEVVGQQKNHDHERISTTIHEETQQRRSTQVNSEEMSLPGATEFNRQSESALQETNLLQPTQILSKAADYYYSTANPEASVPLIIVPAATQLHASEDGIAVLRSQKKTSRFSATASLTQGLSFYHLKGKQTYSATRDEIRNTEERELSTVAALLVNYELNGRWTLQSGFNFSNTIVLIDPKTIYAENVRGIIKYRYNSSAGYAYLLPSFAASPSVGDSLYTMEASHTLQYLGVPVGARYFFKKGKVNLYGAASTTVNVLLKGEIETSIENGVDREIEVIRKLNGLKKVYFSGSVDLGMDYQLSENFSFELAPTARFSINSINKNTPIRSYPFSVGINAGITYRF